MFVFGHMGIGSRLVRPWTTGLPLRFVLLGTLLPDLIDKPLYYGLSWITGRQGAELGLISGTRTFGHTALLLLLLTGIAVFKKSRVFAALCFGVASHLFLDNLGDYFGGAPESAIGTEYALLFPLLGAQFPVMPFENAGEHLQSVGKTYLWVGEILGALLLAWEYWKWSHKSEIFAFIERRRQIRHLRRASRKVRKIR